MENAARYESLVPDQQKYSPPNSNKVEVFPYVEINGERTFSDAIVYSIYCQMVSDKTLEIVFYDGKTKTFEEFLKLLKSRGNYISFVLVNGEITGIAWINEIHDGYASAHFCVLKTAWGKYSREMGRRVIEYWFSFSKEDGSPMFHVLLGVTPSHYRHALKFISEIGFKRVGEVPKVLYDAYQNKRINAVLSYCERP